MNVNTLLFEQFIQHGHKVVVEKDGFIYDSRKPGDGEYMYFLESGLAALMSFTRDGDERVYLYFNERRLIGFAPLLKRSFNFEHELLEKFSDDFFQIAKTRCVLYRIDHIEFDCLMKTNKDFNMLLMQAVTQNYLEILNHFRQAQEENAGTRFCRLLLESSVIRNGMRVMPKSMTFLEMSRYLGTHPVTVSRIVAQLKKLGCIAKEKGVVVIKDEELIRLMVENGVDIK